MHGTDLPATALTGGDASATASLPQGAQQQAGPSASLPAGSSVAPNVALTIQQQDSRDVAAEQQEAQPVDGGIAQLAADSGSPALASPSMPVENAPSLPQAAAVEPAAVGANLALGAATAETTEPVKLAASRVHNDALHHVLLPHTTA